MSPLGQRRVHLALILGSAGITAFQIGLMRLFSFVHWYHFAYMMVSLALLGFGASGAALTWSRRLWAGAPETAAGVCLAAGGLGMPLAAALLAWKPLQFDLYLLFVEPAQLARFALATFLLFLPFLAGAMAIGMLLAHRAREAGSHYFANLLGTAAGGALGLALAVSFLPGRLPALSGLPLLLGALPLLRRRTGRLWTLAATAAAVAAAVWPPAWKPSSFKSLSKVMDLPDAAILDVEPGVQGLTHLVEAPALHPAPGLSLDYRAGLPQGPAFFADGDYYGMLLPPVAPGEEAWESATTEALPYWLRQSAPQRVLSLGAEGSSPLRLALHHGAEAVVAVDRHRAALERIEAAWAGEPSAASVDFRAQSPRVALARAEGSFDLVRFPVVGSFHGGVGLGSLGADFLLTQEAVALAWSRLDEDGALAATAWIDYPERAPLRLLNLLVAGAREAGAAEPERHIAAVRSWGAVTFVLNKRPLDDGQVERARSLCERWAFDPLWLGGRPLPDRERFHQLESRTLFAMADAILAGDRAAAEAYPFALAAPTDDRPFFYQFLRPRGTDAALEAFAARSLPFVELGSFVLLATLLLLALLATAFILAPALLLIAQAKGKTGPGLYFGALGLGYLAIEIVLMQTFHLVWGDPILSAGGTIAGMLLFSGLGSLASGRLPATPRAMRACGGAVAALLALAALAALPYPLSLLLLAALATPMGGLFPLGLRKLSDREPRLVPWAWGVNGALSVVSSPLALLASIASGYSSVLLAAAACYAIALLAAKRV